MKTNTKINPFSAFQEIQIKNPWHLSGGGDCPCADCGASDGPRERDPKKN